MRTAFDNIIDNLKERITASEKRASEAERTFADLRTGMQKIVAENAQFARRINELERALSLSEADIAGGHHRESKLVRERDEARTQTGVWIARATKTESERDEARAALGKVVEALTEILATPFDQERVCYFARTALTHTGKETKE